MVVDVSDLLDQARQHGDFVMFEGAQGTLLDIDHEHLSVRNFFQHHCWWRGDRYGLGPRLC
ncbi:adenylosuccinate synthetase [Shigella sonnei]